VFAYVPAGLGHLRVTDALFHGLPGGIDPLLLGPEDPLLVFFHRLTSVNPVAKAILEWQQHGLQEDIYTKFYRWFLKTQTNQIKERLSLVLAQRMDLPQTVLVVVTHFGLAHQLIAIKHKIEEEKHIKMIIVLQVTDDSPQHLWYVPGVDVIFVPSEKTKNELLEYGRKENLDKVPIEVLPYPIDPWMSIKLTAKELEEKSHQLILENHSAINIAVPISGAAVGMNFITKMVDRLHEKSDRCTFHIIAKSTPFTQNFLKEMVNRSFVRFSVSFSSREIVDKYAELYRQEIISLEITKPSEQAFKALFTPDQKGGSILLFSEPIGRQEYDNLNFLRRHHLIPLKAEMENLWQEAEKNLEIDGGGKGLLEGAKHWRGLILPKDPIRAADFIFWCFREKLLLTMVESYVCPKQEGENKELSSDGVEVFWQRVASLVEEKS